MLRFLTRVMAFLLFTTLVYVMVLTALPRPMPYRIFRNLNVPIGGYGHNYSRLKEASKPGDPDFLILGSSHAYRGYDPRIFSARGYTSFNLGSSSQTIVQSNLLLDRYLSTHHPRVVLMDVLPLGLHIGLVEGTLDLVANGPVDLPTIELVLRARHVRAINAGVHALGKQIIWGPPQANEVEDNGEDRYISGGYVERRLSHYSPVHHDDRKIIMDPTQLDALERIRATLIEKQIKLILVEAPITQVYFDALVGYDHYVERMRKTAPFVNLYGIVPLDDSLHFYDDAHMNQAGVELYDNALIDTLRSMNLLPPPSLATGS